MLKIKLDFWRGFNAIAVDVKSDRVEFFFYRILGETRIESKETVRINELNRNDQ